MQSRRGFLQLLGGSVAAATLDPERLLWVPGAKTISIPKPTALQLGMDWEMYCSLLRPYQIHIISATLTRAQFERMWRIGEIGERQ